MSKDSKTKLKIAVLYTGVYNYFDYTYKSHKNMYDYFDKNNIEYDIWANVQQLIEFRTYKKKKSDAIEIIEKQYSKYPELNKHIPDDYESQLEYSLVPYSNGITNEETGCGYKNINANKIISKDLKYCENQFKNIFGKKLKSYITQPNLVDKMFFDSSDNGISTSGGGSSHHPEYFFNSAVYTRNANIIPLIRKYEKDNNFNYDILISLRPDLMLFNRFKNNLSDIIKGVIENDYNYIYCNGRLDFIFIGKKGFSEIINYNIWKKMYKKNGDLYHFPGNKFPNIEKFAKEYIKNVKNIKHDSLGKFCDKYIKYYNTV